MSLLKRAVAVGSAAVVAMSCANGTGPTGDVLDDAEVQAIAGELMGVAVGEGLGSLYGAQPTARAVNADPISFSFSVNESAACPGGSGTVQIVGSLSGSIDDVTQDGTLALDFTQTMNACALETASGMFTLDGDPDLRLSGDISWNAEGPTGESTFGYEGGFAWSDETGRSGTCGIDVSLTWSATSASYTGEICGNTYTATVGTT